MYAPTRLLLLFVLSALLAPTVTAVPVPAGSPKPPGGLDRTKTGRVDKSVSKPKPKPVIPGASSFDAFPDPKKPNRRYRNTEIPPNPNMPTIHKPNEAPGGTGRPNWSSYVHKEANIPGRAIMNMNQPAFNTIKQPGGKPASNTIKPGDKISFEQGKLTYTIVKNGPQPNTYFLSDPSLMAKMFETYHPDPMTRERNLVAFSTEAKEFRKKHPSKMLQGGDAEVNGVVYGWLVHPIV